MSDPFGVCDVVSREYVRTLVDGRADVRSALDEGAAFEVRMFQEGVVWSFEPVTPFGQTLAGHMYLRRRTDGDERPADRLQVAAAVARSKWQAGGEAWVLGDGTIVVIADRQQTERFTPYLAVPVEGVSS
ncbi:hypothetical protein ACFZAM_32035 [Streptomyces sp. NPDC008079]|uniref:hypothetical protein n=1 Tax=Streptomyces sp. NPDC008079 TaxID=3364806 RepID=UPI0036E03E08